jgi:hypothetical protein
MKFVALDNILIEEAGSAIGDRLWRTIRSLDIVVGRRTNRPTHSKIVGGSKALHHLLRDLMPPVDRTYTAVFLLRIDPHYFQDSNHEGETFRVAFESFCGIARGTNPAQPGRNRFAKI